MVRKLGVLALFLTLGIFSFNLRASAEEKEDFNKSFNLNSRGTVSLENVNGSVVIKTWNEPRVEVHAIKSGPSQQKLDLVKINIDSQPDQLKIDTVYPKGIRNVNVSVKYEITVPKTINLSKIETVNGSVEISGIEGYIKTQTVNGSINIIGGNTVFAETVNGSIKANLSGFSSNEKAKFETVNGSINLYLSENLDADLDAETVNGKITTDVALTSSNLSEKKHLKGKLGKGGPKLNLETVNGSITISKSSGGKEL